MQPMHILLLGPDGAHRAALEETLTRLGCVVLSADSRLCGVPPRAGDVVVADLRRDGEDWGRLAERLRDDPRPLVMVADRPRRLVRALSGRSAGTLVMTGAESDAGYRVALGVCAALRQSGVRRERIGGTGGWGSIAARNAAC
jgi:CheY-like chemotaxis protein